LFFLQAAVEVTRKFCRNYLPFSNNYVTVMYVSCKKSVCYHWHFAILQIVNSYCHFLVTGAWSSINWWNKQLKCLIPSFTNLHLLKARNPKRGYRKCFSKALCRFYWYFVAHTISYAHKSFVTITYRQISEQEFRQRYLLQAWYSSVRRFIICVVTDYYYYYLLSHL
jgi:hypothetical protein